MIIFTAGLLLAPLLTTVTVLGGVVLVERVALPELTVNLELECAFWFIGPVSAFVGKTDNVSSGQIFEVCSTLAQLTPPVEISGLAAGFDVAESKWVLCLKDEWN